MSPSISGVCRGWKTGHTWRVSWTSFQCRRTVWVKHSAERKLDLEFVILGFLVWCAFWGGRRWKTAPRLDKMDWKKNRGFVKWVRAYPQLISMKYFVLFEIVCFHLKLCCITNNKNNIIHRTLLNKRKLWILVLKELHLFIHAATLTLCASHRGL